MNKQAFLRGQQGPRTLFEVRKVAGSTTYKQNTAVWIVLSFKLSLFIHFIQSWKQREFDYSVCLGRKKSANEHLSLLINISNKTTDCSFNV